MSQRAHILARVLTPVAASLLLLTACTSDPEPAPEPTTATTSETLIPPSDLGDVTVEGTVRLTGDTGSLAGALHNNSPDEISVTGISCACATGITLGTIDNGEFIPLSGGIVVAAGTTLTFGGEGELQVELSGLLPTTVPDAVVPVMAFINDRNPVQGVATVEAP